MATWIPQARANARKNFSIRGPVHGLQGSASSQHLLSARQATKNLSHSQVMRLQKKSDAAEAARHILQEPDIQQQEDGCFSAPDFNMPFNKHAMPEDQLGSNRSDSDSAGKDAGEDA